jgi:hypothetical protein
MFLLNRNDYYLNNKYHLIDFITSFSGQHHSSNTLDEQYVISSENVHAFSKELGNQFFC